MNTTNVSTLKIHKLTQAQYDRELAAGRIDENALYLTPDEEIDLSGYATKEELNNKANTSHTHDYLPLSGGTITGDILIADRDTYMYSLGSENSAFLELHVGTVYGNATSASRLATNGGSATQPVYFSDGKPVACTYTLGKSVPSDAKFTDTTYTLGSFGITATATELNKMDGVTATTAELNYVDGVTSNIQTQLNGKASSKHTHNSLYHTSSGERVAVVGQGSDSTSGVTYYYLRPDANVASISMLGSPVTPWYDINAQQAHIKTTVAGKLIVDAGKPVFKYCGTTDGTGLSTVGSTVSYVANAFIGTGGTLSRSTNTSSRTIKHDIKDLEDDNIKAELLYDLPVHQAKYNADILGEDDDRYLKDLPMFIIEEMNEIYPAAVDKPTDNVKDWSWNSQYMIPPMLKLIQEQKKEIDLLKEEINALKEVVNK